MIVYLLACVVLDVVITAAAVWYGLRRRRWLALSEEEQLLATRLAAIKKEVKKLVKVIPVALAQQNKLIYIKKNEGGAKPGMFSGRRVYRVQFDAAVYNEWEIWFHIEGSRLPFGISFYDLTNPDNQVIYNLERAIRRPCAWFEDTEFNLFLRVGLKGAIAGIPTVVKWRDVVDQLPKSRPMNVVIGQGENNKLIHRDIRSFPHLLVAGATQQGKSTWLVNAITTLIKNNGPSALQFVLVDLKEGVEFHRFKDVPHVKAFVDEAVDVQEQLEAIMREHKRRMLMFKGVCQDIRGWNAQRPDKLPYVFLIVDELADLMLDKELKGRATETIQKIAQKGRASGFHMILCSQIITKEVLTIIIRGNIPGRICFSVPGFTESMLMMSNGTAAGLSPVGRCVYRDGTKNSFLQAPIAFADEVEEVIQAAMGNKPIEAGERGLTADDIWRTALWNFEGEAKVRELFDQMQPHGASQHWIRSNLKAHDFDFDKQGPVISIEGEGEPERFILVPDFVTAKGPQPPRRLLAVNGHLPATREELGEMLRCRVTGVVDSEKYRPPQIQTDLQSLELHFEDDFEEEE